MEPLRGAALLLLLLLAAVAAVCWAQQEQGCVCPKNKRTTNCSLSSGTCRCMSFGSQVSVGCDTLTSKCLLMKAEMAGSKKAGRRRPKFAYVDNDGIYDPDCENSGIFKARQCNGTSCWCVNTAGARRTEKSDRDLQCSELVRTSWIIIETKHTERSTAVDVSHLNEAIKNEFFKRYLLAPKYISDVTYKNPSITIELKQNLSQKSDGDVDIADVAYYFEKDVKDDTLIQNGMLQINISGEPLKFDQTLIYYVDEKAPEFSMKRLTGGVIAVIVVVILAIVAGIVVLVITRKRRSKYEKSEAKEMNEMQRELNP
ncbi:epithelial cell adhesion molecule isoform X2 [Dermochelys coriacea]|uniref:epithelial cell adhesion molecule isoform X2 n=1 Tax=Dermochelys coriacea TaxID=27794 RepID=UPI0018E8FD41|nr:epithelial cell adhesion molecule isoform X2 [Dermochelys coriacea]